jgi:hypothetical protein
MQISLSELNAKVVTAMVTHQIQFNGNCKFTASATGEGVKNRWQRRVWGGWAAARFGSPMWGVSAAMMMQ